MEQIRKLMKDGAYAEVEALLRKRIDASDGDVEAKTLYGLCRRLQGDEAEFIRIDDELRASHASHKSSLVEKYHALRIAACGTLLLLATGCEGFTSEPAPPCDVYAGPPQLPRTKQESIQTPARPKTTPVRKTPKSQQMPPACVYAGPEQMGRRMSPNPMPTPPPPNLPKSVSPQQNIPVMSPVVIQQNPPTAK